MNELLPVCRITMLVRRLKEPLDIQGPVMEAEKSLTFRLESYLVQLADINRRWGAWLSGNELALVSRDSKQINALEPQATALFTELRQVILDRQKILDDAGQIGLACGDLSTLARRLPAWEKPSLRNSLDLARQQLINLRRLHFATWVLISQAVNFYSESLHMLIVGDRPHVYEQGRQTDTGGGRLLDADL